MHRYAARPRGAAVFRPSTAGYSYYPPARDSSRVSAGREERSMRRGGRRADREAAVPPVLGVLPAAIRIRRRLCLRGRYRNRNRIPLGLADADTDFDFDANGPCAIMEMAALPVGGMLPSARVNRDRVVGESPPGDAPVVWSERIRSITLRRHRRPRSAARASCRMCPVNGTWAMASGNGEFDEREEPIVEEARGGRQPLSHPAAPVWPSP